MTKFFLGILLGIAPLVASAQNDSTKVSGNAGDSILVNRRGKVMSAEAYAKRFSPRKALLYSAILPGAGQVYNKKYWKVPLVYGAIAGGIYILDFYGSEHSRTREQLFRLLNDTSPVEDPNKKGYTLQGNLLLNGTVVSPETKLNVEQLRNRETRFRRDRDFAVVMLSVVYFAQLIDAHVDAHLKEFDLYPQLKMSWKPSVQSTGLYSRSTGLSLTFTF